MFGEASVMPLNETLDDVKSSLDASRVLLPSDDVGSRGRRAIELLCDETTPQTRSDPLPKPPVVDLEVVPTESSPAQHSSLATLVSNYLIKNRESAIALAKKRCAEQLEAISTRKWPKVKMTMKSKELLNNFSLVWEHALLPFLIECIPRWCGPGFVISVFSGRKADQYQICLSLKKPISTARRILVAWHLRDLLPVDLWNNVTFKFFGGRSLADDALPTLPDTPRNPFSFASPDMGDSVGVELSAPAYSASATLGPCIEIDNDKFWLTSLSPFYDKNDGSRKEVFLEHPSPEDRQRCLDAGHDILSADNSHYQLGKLLATSGLNLDTVRVSHNRYWADNYADPPLTTVDWALFSSNAKQANLPRRLPGSHSRKVQPVTSVGQVYPGARVSLASRTSGLQEAWVCQIPAYVDASTSRGGKATREWFIEQKVSDRLNGLFKPDSGAALVNTGTNKLIGQVWNPKLDFGPHTIHTFFTPMEDLLDDIQERYGTGSRPKLPQHRDKADYQPVYPQCRQCYDLQKSLVTRQGSASKSTSKRTISDDSMSDDSDAFESDLSGYKHRSPNSRHHDRKRLEQQERARVDFGLFTPKLGNSDRAQAP
ncbi:hypothetical protein F5Y16DRAFT_118328 [Xylariaceae sp. FL0255]|nr:hypothetical protein F5Y16DRAFT_118328 [Xylariaceae sp. FL0255]